MACSKKNRKVINRQLIAVEEEFKEWSQRQAYRMVKKEKD
jgi:hypothetical protein